jgi:hypothetical protein
VGSTLDLPRPGRSALAFGVLAVAALALNADPKLPWIAGVVTAALFSVAGTVRIVHERHELAEVRRAADALIVHTPGGPDVSELVRWRSQELTAHSARDALRREVERTLRSLDPARLPSSSPLRRPAARGCEAQLVQLARRLGDERPVAARGILLTRGLLRDPASPLYSDEAPLALPRAVRRCVGALEP